MKDGFEIRGETILVVDDEDVTLLMMDLLLTGAGFAVKKAKSAVKALEMIGAEQVDLVLTDQEMPEMDGLELLERVKAIRPNLPVIIFTAHGSLPKAVASIKKGADDYLNKLVNQEEILAVIRRSLEFSRMSEANLRLKAHLTELYSFHVIQTQSPLMKECLELAEKVAKSAMTTVCLSGESGTGKEVLARAIHFSGERMDAPFVAVNCAGIPAGLLESELFGHVKGAFTGADRDHAGRFATAANGTLLLDEIADMPLGLQAKLLRVLQERVYEPVGSNKSLRANCRVITSTNRKLWDMVKAGAFREDLYHRINAFPIILPPLRQRREDIPLLAGHFLSRLSDELGRPVFSLAPDALATLSDNFWPGNIRELKNCLERAAIISDGSVIQIGHLGISPAKSGPKEVQTGRDGRIILTVSVEKEDFGLDALVGRILEIALEKFGKNKSRAAAWLKVDRKMFYRR
ncbi:MAG: sigma-54-dependent Fis family transcriptional regulator [Deltaproteobacteria bacterium]|nr:sigma-54-dependent Fis family transcriptional regulator [Deltaproteobacteria bacterium]